MIENKTGFLKEILNNRRSLLELISAAVLVGFGIELIAASIYGHFNFNHKNSVFFYVGFAFLIVGFIYFIINFFGKKTFSKELTGFFILDRIKKEIIQIDSYDFSNKLGEHLDIAFAEDQALKKIWSNLKFDTVYHNDIKEDFLKIINEASEYYLLEKLSRHLSQFFNDFGYEENEIVEYERNDIPDILLKNRFLELFSKPMDQRVAFIPDGPIEKQEEDPQEKVVACFTDGAMFVNFELILPKKSRVKRNIDNSISIITPRFTLKLNSITDGTGTYIPWEFCMRYLGLTNPLDISELIVTFHIDITFHFGSLFKTIGWRYYNWIDSFVVELEKDFSKDYYFNDKIEWDKAYTIIKCLQDGKTLKPNITHHEN